LRHVPTAATAAGPPHVHAVRIDPRIVAPPAVDGCSAALQRPRDVAGISGLVHPGNEGLDAVDVPRGGDGAENVLADRLLSLRALHVDDWGLTGDRDRLLERADFEIAVHRRHEGAG